MTVFFEPSVRRRFTTCSRKSLYRLCISSWTLLARSIQFPNTHCGTTFSQGKISIGGVAPKALIRAQISNKASILRTYGASMVGDRIP